MTKREEVIEKCFEHLSNYDIECNYNNVLQFMKKNYVCGYHLAEIVDRVLKIHQEHVEENCPCCLDKKNT